MLLPTVRVPVRSNRCRVRRSVSVMKIVSLFGSATLGRCTCRRSKTNGSSGTAMCAWRQVKPTVQPPRPRTIWPVLCRSRLQPRPDLLLMIGMVVETVVKDVTEVARCDQSKAQWRNLVGSVSRRYRKETLSYNRLDRIAKTSAPGSLHRGRLLKPTTSY